MTLETYLNGFSGRGPALEVRQAEALLNFPKVFRRRGYEVVYETPEGYPIHQIEHERNEKSYWVAFSKNGRYYIHAVDGSDLVYTVVATP